MPRTFEVLIAFIKKGGLDVFPMPCSVIEKNPSVLQRAVLFYGDLFGAEFAMVKELAADTTVGQNFAFFYLKSDECLDVLNITSSKALMMFRNRVYPKPATYSGHYYREVMVPWLWNRVTPPWFDFNTETVELSRN